MDLVDVKNMFFSLKNREAISNSLYDTCLREHKIELDGKFRPTLDGYMTQVYQALGGQVPAGVDLMELIRYLDGQVVMHCLQHVKTNLVPAAKKGDELYSMAEKLRQSRGYGEAPSQGEAPRGPGANLRSVPFDQEGAGRSAATQPQGEYDLSEAEQGSYLNLNEILGTSAPPAASQAMALYQPNPPRGSAAGDVISLDLSQLRSSLPAEPTPARTERSSAPEGPPRLATAPRTAGHDSPTRGDAPSRPSDWRSAPTNQGWLTVDFRRDLVQANGAQGRYTFLVPPHVRCVELVSGQVIGHPALLSEPYLVLRQADTASVTPSCHLMGTQPACGRLNVRSGVGTEHVELQPVGCELSSQPVMDLELTRYDGSPVDLQRVPISRLLKSRGNRKVQITTSSPHGLKAADRVLVTFQGRDSVSAVNVPVSAVIDGHNFVLSQTGAFYQQSQIMIERVVNCNLLFACQLGN